MKAYYAELEFWGAGGALQATARHAQARQQLPCKVSVSEDNPRTKTSDLGTAGELFKTMSLLGRG